jgi:hypothetical protein
MIIHPVRASQSDTIPTSPATPLSFNIIVKIALRNRCSICLNRQSSVIFPDSCEGGFEAPFAFSTRVVLICRTLAEVIKV